jgi:polyphosphate kinase 2 (PPK2 family)
MRSQRVSHGGERKAIFELTEREKSQIDWQRYIAHLPAGGQVVILGRNW